MRESATIQGEGNIGSSLYNAVNYVLGLKIVHQFAEFMADIATVSESLMMLARAQDSIQANFWQPDVGFYLGDTDGRICAGGKRQCNHYTLENNGYPFHSSDDLHGAPR